MTRTMIALGLFMLVSATALAQDNAAFPTTVEGFSFGGARRAQERVCTSQGGTWASGECTLGSGADQRVVSFDTSCRRDRVCRIDVTYVETLAADDRAGWTARFMSLKQEYERRFNATMSYRSGQRDCYAQAAAGNAECVYESSANAIAGAIPVAGDNRTRGEVQMVLRYNLMRRSPSIIVKWHNAAAVWEDENVHEGPYPQ